MTRSKATCIGLIAIVLWSAIVGLIRGVSTHFGAVGGAALIYSVASVLLWLTLGFPPLREFPRRYIVWGSVLFIAYELCLSLSIGYSHNARQAIEVGMVNYLWPTFTIMAAIMFNHQRATWWIAPGFALSMLGIAWVLAGEQGLDVHAMLRNVQANPLSYGLAFSGALIWAAYCVVTARMAAGKNGVVLFFMLVAVTLWLQYAITGGDAMTWNMPAVLWLAAAAGAMGFGYAAWNVGILHGNMTVLAGASYFIPVFSAFLSAVMLSAPLPLPFWQGAGMVCAGSVLCWVATRG